MEAASDVISGLFVGLIAQDKAVKFPDPGLNSSREIRPKAVEDCMFGPFSALLLTILVNSIKPGPLPTYG